MTDDALACHPAQNCYADKCAAVMSNFGSIHDALRETIHDAVCGANIRTASRMAELLGDMTPEVRALDLGSACGSASRFLAQTHDCQVVAINRSEEENSRARLLNKQQGLASQIDVVTGDYRNIPYGNNEFGVVWSQDAGLKPHALAEVARVLRCGGKFVFSGTVQGESNEGTEPRDVFPLGFYSHEASKAGMRAISHEELTPRLVRQCRSALAAIVKHRDELVQEIGHSGLDRLKSQLEESLEGARKNQLAWGISLFQKMVM